jgi:hypothetical protein
MRKQIPMLVGALLLCCLATTILLVRPTQGQQAPAANPAVNGRFVGRYQMTLAIVGGTPYLVVLDTATGRSWSRPAATTDDEPGEWTPYGSPEDPKPS